MKPQPRPRRLDQQGNEVGGAKKPARPTSPLPDQALQPAPNKIGVPNCDELYVPGSKFYQFKKPNSKMILDPFYDEGWKLHLPLTDSGCLSPPDLTSSRRKRFAVVEGETEPPIPNHDGYCYVFIYLQKTAVPHKFVPTRSLLRTMEQDPQQKGKFLTIYPTGQEEMFEVITMVEKYLLPMVGCFTGVTHAPGEKLVGSLKIITARYGGLTGDHVLKSVAQTRHLKVTDATDEWANPDDKSKCKPDHIRDPFDKYSYGDSGWYHHSFFILRNADDYDPATRRMRQ